MIIRLVLLVIPFIFIPGGIQQAMKPDFSMEVSGGVIDLVVMGDELFVATDKGIVDVIDWESKTCLKRVKVPGIVDFMDENQPAKIHSVDVALDSRILIVSQGEKGFRDVYIGQEGVLTKIINAQHDKMMVKKARFVDEELILMGLLSNELVLYDLDLKNAHYRIQISTSAFSDFQLNEDHSQYVVSDESGIISLVNTLNGAIILKLDSENVDNVYQVDFKNGQVVGAGQDRRVSLYTLPPGRGCYILSDFLVYSVGLSPSGKKGAFQANENNDVKVFETVGRTISHTLTGHHTTVTKIVFLTEVQLITGSDDPMIHFWIL